MKLPFFCHQREMFLQVRNKTGNKITELTVILKSLIKVSKSKQCKTERIVS